MSVSFFFVVPTLNSYKLLPRLLNSLQCQTWQAWRLLFVDGLSCEEHREWLSKCVASDSRCAYVQQHPSEKGIFGAMNQGFDACSSSDYLCFWGSDDWAPNALILEDLASVIEKSASQGVFPDLIVCQGRYVRSVSGRFSRSAVFKRNCILDSEGYKRSLISGSTPPHQASLLGPGIRKRFGRYAAGFSLSADLDYFLRLSSYSDLCVQCVDLEFVHMSDGGVSGKQTSRRLQEVRRAYFSAYGWLWLFPFLCRYIRRLVGLVHSWH